MDDSRVTIVADADALAERAADHFVAYVSAAIAQRGTANVALAGGSTPRAMNARLIAQPRRGQLDWTKIAFYFGDERCVPPDHIDSNFRMTSETLFAPLGIAPAKIHRIRGEDEPDASAAAYEATLTKQLGTPPVLDMVFLGMGPDGHTASLFPGTIAAIASQRWSVSNFVPKFDIYRITLTARTINAARAVTITAAGAEKAAALAAVLEGPRDPDRYPAQLVAPLTGELRWFVDAAAAQDLHGKT